MAGLALCLAACASLSAPRVVADGTVIEDVTLISPERQIPLPHATVVIRGGRIAEIGTDLVAGPRAKRIDGRGCFRRTAPSFHEPIWRLALQRWWTSI
ncbi:MAG TPA: hypothetical protein VF332_09675 [Vicinamibacterales bacterium]